MAPAGVTIVHCQYLQPTVAFSTPISSHWPCRSSRHLVDLVAEHAILFIFIPLLIWSPATQHCLQPTARHMCTSRLTADLADGHANPTVPRRPSLDTAARHAPPPSSLQICRASQRRGREGAASLWQTLSWSPQLRFQPAGAVHSRAPLLLREQLDKLSP